MNFGPMNLDLATQRFALRLPRPTDAERMAVYLNDFGVAGNLARVPHPYRLADARAWLRTRRDNLPPEETNFIIDWPGEGLVGQVGFHRRDRDTILGYWLARPFWGRGIMTEAAIGVVDWLFAMTREQQIISGVFTFNAASWAIQQKLGFIETGRSTLLCLARGKEVEHIDTQLTRARWTQDMQ